MQGNHSQVDIDSRVMKRIEDFLRQEMGLDAGTTSASHVVNAVRRRMAACAQTDIIAYLARLLESPAEQESLIEEVVVPETWFFREQNAFRALRRFVIRDWLPAVPPGAVLRVLSLPCSTGEEAWSIAMALVDAGLPLRRFHIDAVDISQQALARARRAVYGANSFRGDETGFRERFFTREGERHVLKASLRQQVSFLQGNLLDADFLPGQGLYDVIFCRNLLIYFDHATQVRAVKVLTRLLRPQGVIFVGHAESCLMLDQGYVPLSMPRAFGFRRAAATRAHKWQVQPLASRRKPAPAAPPVAPAKKKAEAKPRVETDPLEQAFALANEGRLAEAARLCEARLQHDAASVRACYLLGLIHEAAGDVHEAEACLRKAVYLQPDHQEALVHLALLVERRGDGMAARQLRQRASRHARGAG